MKTLRRGFTLVEALVVVSVVLLLAALIVPGAAAGEPMRSQEACNEQPRPDRQGVHHVSGAERRFLPGAFAVLHWHDGRFQADALAGDLVPGLR